MEPARAVPSRLASVSRQPKLVPEPVPVLFVQNLAFQHCLEQLFSQCSLWATFAEANNDLLLARDVLQTKFSDPLGFRQVLVGHLSARFVHDAIPLGTDCRGPRSSRARPVSQPATPKAIVPGRRGAVHARW